MVGEGVNVDVHELCNILKVFTEEVQVKSIEVFPLYTRSTGMNGYANARDDVSNGFSVPV